MTITLATLAAATIKVGTIHPTNPTLRRCYVNDIFVGDVTASGAIVTNWHRAGEHGCQITVVTPNGDHCDLHYRNVLDVVWMSKVASVDWDGGGR